MFSEQQFADELAVLQQNFAQRLPAKLQHLQETWHVLLNSSWDSVTCATLHRLIHNLAGTGASFGFTSLTETAQTLERLFEAVLETGKPPSVEQRVQLQVLFDALQAAGNNPDKSPASKATTTPVSLQVITHARKVMVMAPNDTAAEDLVSYLTNAGYPAACAAQLDDVLALSEEERPAVLLLDRRHCHVLSEMQRVNLNILRQLGIPSVVVADRTDLPTRLQAVRDGAVAYCLTPLNTGILIDVLDQLTERRKPDPYRVLVVDDEPILAAYYEAVLTQAGMTTRVVTDPLQTLDVLEELRPDVIVMDMYMPDCSGMELAAVIRQQPTYLGVPIVFLSMEADPKRQFAALQLGGDDFLSKPIQPEHLVSAVTSRVHRARLLHGRMTRDSLTGLLNHSRFREQLESELVRAMRKEQPLVLAILDIDHFKHVNDTYGHPVGDRVIKSLARLLLQRLRRSDIVGRTGGEEFAVIFPDTDAVTAQAVLDDIRKMWANLQQQAADETFHVTISGGIACSTHHRDSAELMSAADQALYMAKRGGRNQVWTAD